MEYQVEHIACFMVCYGVKLAAMKVESLDRGWFLIAGMNLRLRIR